MVIINIVENINGVEFFNSDAILTILKLFNVELLVAVLVKRNNTIDSDETKKSIENIVDKHGLMVQANDINKYDL